MGVGLARSLAPLFSQPRLTTGAQTVSDLFNVFGGATDLSRARTPAATAGGALRTVSGLSGLGRQFDLPGAGAVSAATGLGGAGLNLARGNIPGGVQNLITGAGTVANLFPASATLAGVPVSAAGGAATGGLAATEAGIGLGGGAPLTGASLAGAAGALAIPFVVGQAVETIVNAGLGEGMFGPTSLPFGRGNNFSSADNLASQMSKFASLQGENQVREAVQKATSPTDLLALALGGPNLSAHGEIQFFHPEFGFGGDWDDPMAPSYNEAVQRIARTGDPELLRRFIGGIVIQTGETGMPAPSYLLTDWYRRKLVSLLPETHPLRQNPAGLFEPTPTRYLPQARSDEYLQTLAQLNQQYAGGGPTYTAEDAIRGLLAGNVGHESIATLFRPEGELLDRATAERLVRAHPAFASAPPVAAPPPEAFFPSLQVGGYVQAPPGRSVAATIHGGEYVVPAGPVAERLREGDEEAFQAWYAKYARQLGLSLNPDDPEHFYDWRAAYRAGATPDASGHWPSVFKREGHPNLIIDGIDTRTGEPVPQNNGVAPGLDTRRTPLRDYLLARSTGQGDFQGAPVIGGARSGLNSVAQLV